MVWSHWSGGSEVSVVLRFSSINILVIEAAEGSGNRNVGSLGCGWRGSEVWVVGLAWFDFGVCLDLGEYCSSLAWFVLVLV